MPATPICTWWTVSGQKYTAMAAGGDAIGEIELEGDRTLQGWFEFAMPAIPSGPLTFVDDDMTCDSAFCAPKLENDRSLCVKDLRSVRPLSAG